MKTKLGLKEIEKSLKDKKSFKKFFENHEEFVMETILAYEIILAREGVQIGRPTLMTAIATVMQMGYLLRDEELKREN